MTVDRTAALEQGLTEVQVLGIVAGTLSPQSVGSIALDGDELDIYIEGPDAPATVAELEQLILPTAAGFAPLSSVATVEEVTVPTSITRQSGDLTSTISLTPEEGELGAVSASVQETLADLDLPSGVTAEVGGLAETQAASFEQLGIAMLVAIAIVFMLLVATFRSLVQPLILLVSIPFAATGAIALLLATGTPLGISALIGMLMLIGIVVTNAIVLIDLVNQYRAQGQSVSNAVFNGARQRLRPILMTALATIFALIPMAIGVTGSSGFISQDLAIVVIGGLVSSTLLTLILVPVLYRLVEGRRERQGEPEGRGRRGAGAEGVARRGRAGGVARAAGVAPAKQPRRSARLLRIGRTYDGRVTPDRQTGGAMVQVRVLGVALDAAGQHIVLLKPLLVEPGEGRVLPVWIGGQEATSILIAVEGQQAPRPLSHDLITTLFAAVGARVERVDVTRIEEGTFYAELTLSTPSGPQVIDSRPSDAIALALRADAPIWVADDVIDEAGIPAEMVDIADDEAEKVDEFKRFLDDVDPEDFQG